MSATPSPKKDHFQGKTALRHIAEVQSGGISSSLEVHGSEAPGPVFAFLDAARESLLFFAMGLFILEFTPLSGEQQFTIGLCFGIGLLIWKGLRGGSLAWSRLARLHRIALEEKEEIEANRSQEREELVVLYGAKGFSGELLETVVDVLMADQDRLLKVMLQEELGCRLEETAHPLVQGVGASLGVAFSFLLFPLAMVTSSVVVAVVSVLLIGVIGALAARIERNPVIPACSSHLVMAAVIVICVKTCMEIVAR